MPKTIAKKSVETTVVIRDSKGREAARNKAEIIITPGGEFMVRFLDGDWMKGVEATFPAAAAADALGERSRR